MFKIKNYIIVISIAFLLLVCSGYSVVNNQISTTINTRDNSSRMNTIPFEYFFRGFITLKNSQIVSYPQETYIIQTAEDWGDFMGKYVPGIPYFKVPDFSREYLVFSVLFPVKPTYSIGADIKTFSINDNKLEPEYINSATLGITNGIYAQNTDEIEHSFVNIVIIDKKDIPKGIKNIYYKGNVFNSK